MKTLNIFLLAMALAVSVTGQSSEKILKTAEKALGGTKALRAVMSVSKTGRITRISDGALGNYNSHLASPDQYQEKIEIDGFETETATNGRSGWSRNSRDGLQTLTGAASVELRARAAFRNHLWLDRKREKSKTTYSGQVKLGNSTVNVVTLTTVKGVTVRIHFDVATGLPVRDEIKYADRLETRDYADYRSIGALKYPFLESIAAGGETYELKLESIETNRVADAAVFNFPVMSKEPLPDVRTLLTELQANEERVETLLENYSFTQTIGKRVLDKDGTLRDAGSETYKMSFYKGNRIKRLVEKDGKPLSDKDQRDEDREVAKRVEEIEKRLAKNGGKPTPDDDRRISIAEMLKASNLINPRRERVRGREVIVFDFEPNQNFDYRNSKSILKFFGKTTGVMWIDERDKQVARIEAYLDKSFGVGGGIIAKLKKGASFTLEQERVNDEIWLPSVAEINLSVRVLLVKGVDLNQIVRSFDYRKFQTEVKDAKVNDPQSSE